ncbi:hypothetical protein [Streptomyces soliscabiei]|nr:hypothetical protein [Streptomyces sp. NY05-11A]MDX2683669.1 hypothetical protein [Streptomyces sp. NY05-11A]
MAKTAVITMEPTAPTIMKGLRTLSQSESRPTRTRAMAFAPQYQLA